jgi:hypothetical protein
MSQELINSKLDELNSLPDEESGNLYIPVKYAIQEAKILYKVCIKDKEKLIKTKLDWNLVEDLNIRIGALKQSQSKWLAKFKNYEECQKSWKLEAPLGYKFRDELIHDFRHALRNIPTEYAKVKKISEGTSQADMIQDLNDLAELGQIHIAELESIGFDMTKLDEARSMSNSLLNLNGDVKTLFLETRPLIELRNKAYMHLKEAVDEIRCVGQYVFWKAEKRQKAYASAYLRKRSRAQRKTGDKAEPDTNV